MIEECPLFHRSWKGIVHLVLPLFERRRIEVGRSAVEDRAITRPADGLSENPGEPEEVIRTSGPDPAIRPGVPPVKNVALQKLSLRSLDEVFLCQSRIEGEKSIYILELVAKSDCPA
jgi:hypothetical protein